MNSFREHVVFFPAADGSPAFRRYPSLEEALRFVEHLRNVEEVSDVSLHALTEVPLAFRPYYRVELTTAPVAAPPTPAAEPAVEVPEQVVDELPDEEPVDGEPAGAGRRGIGFFAH